MSAGVQVASMMSFPLGGVSVDACVSVVDDVLEHGGSCGGSGGVLC